MKPVTAQVDDKVIISLRDEAKKNQVFNALCHMFVLRKRTRGRLTVTRLKQAMDAEGFTFTRKDYESTLRFLGSLGLGQLSLSPRGKVKALNNLKFRLQSIGNHALGSAKVAKLEKRQEVNKYSEIVASQNDMHNKDFIENVTNVVAKPSKKATIRAEEPYPTFLTMLVGGKPINIPGPSNITPENLGEFIVQFKALTAKAKTSKGDLDI